MIDIDVSTPVSRDGWFKSSYSSAAGACVEVKFSSEATLVRDSKDGRHDQPLLRVASKGWQSFLATLTEA